MTFDVTANTTADMDTNGGQQPAGTKINIHTNSDVLDTTPDAPLNAGELDRSAALPTRPRSPRTARKSTSSTTMA